MLERRDRLSKELEDFLKGQDKEKTWNDVFIWDFKIISEHLNNLRGIDVEIKNISIIKARVTIKKTKKYYVVAGKYDVFLENNEFKVISRDKRDERYIAISLERFYNDVSFTKAEKVMEKIEIETATFFEEEKVKCYPLNHATSNAINDIVLANKLKLDSCDSE